MWGVLGQSGHQLWQIYSDQIYLNGTLLSTSDERVKTNLRNIDSSLVKVRKVKGVKFDMKYNLPDTMPKGKKNKIINSGKNRLGFIAQDLKVLFPELVHQDDSTGLYRVDYLGMIPVLVEALKDQQNQIDSLKQLINKKGSGNLKSAEIPTTVESADIKTSDVATLSQNAPNPFSQSTNIAYYLPGTVQNATIYVYDMNGVQIKSIPIASKGNGSITINGYELRSGMYLYTLIADGKEVATKRMILTQ
jgi:hypothetical protein